MSLDIYSNESGRSSWDEGLSVIYDRDAETSGTSAERASWEIPYLLLSTIFAEDVVLPHQD